ncbi:50S ribosomal protein L2 [bacterium (Candidatus Torokbacteria) CG_4_10_14_0_2_um_filter_35_8]|nr:MAG: 50S ribosomal protein L2 [bacterium (Candidatus Torokbacteria) CG_4_10_14_0_2_um_filter_35_8]
MSNTKAKKSKPITPGMRHLVTSDYSLLSKKRPERALSIGTKRKAGRNAQGKITVRRRGGGAKRKYREIDFKQDKWDIPGKIVSIEYDPFRSAFIALISYKDGEKRYIIAFEGAKVNGQVLSSQKRIDIKQGNRLPLRHIPRGEEIFNVELQESRGGVLIRSAGSRAIVLARGVKYTQIKMPSGEIRLIPSGCLASIGRVSNIEHKSVKLGKAGRSRRLRRRPHVRGKAMNPKDHPHGGGEGRSPIGMKAPKTKWGKLALGVRTRKKKRSDRLILKRRKS